MLHHVKLAALWIASLAPGDLGAAAETRRLRRLRTSKMAAALADFDQHLAALGPDSLCLDLGANVGEYTVKLAAKAGHVHAFEPDPWTFEQLRERTARLTNVTLHNVAVGTSEGAVKMRRAANFHEDPLKHSIGTSVIDHTQSLEVGETIDVQQIDFLRFVQDLGRPVDLVKMDIEGAEVPLLEAILASDLHTQLGAVFVETHEVNIPELRPGVAALRARIATGRFGHFNLDWP